VNPRALRVLHVLGELRPSGAETMLEVAAPLFAQAGVTGEILSIGSEPGPFARRLAKAGYRIHHVPFHKSPAFFRRIFRLLRTGYDVVHLHVERAPFWISLTAMAAGVPTILKTIHNCFAFTGNLRLRRKVQRHLMARFGVRQVAVSPSVRDTERSHFGLETEIIGNWFDAARFEPPGEAERQAARRALVCADGDVVMVSVANCNDFKNHGELLRALALLPPGKRPLWLHVGAEEGGRPEWELARTLGVADRVRFVGSLDDVRTALHAADAFVMPSLREGLPISALEAMATGLPAILTDVPGLRDLRPLFPGVIWAEPSARPLAEALLAFVSLDPESRRHLSRDHSAIVRRAYDARAGVESYVRIYRSRP
jgi:glycosyltransferase involved in cell wall biosynthesis